MDYTDEIAHAIEHTYINDSETAIGALSELYQITGDIRFQEMVERVASEHLLCPKCFGKLEFKKRCLSCEFWGNTTPHIQFYMSCPACGWKEE